MIAVVPPALERDCHALDQVIDPGGGGGDSICALDARVRQCILLRDEACWPILGLYDGYYLFNKARECLGSLTA